MDQMHETLNYFNHIDSFNSNEVFNFKEYYQTAENHFKLRPKPFTRDMGHLYNHTAEPNKQLGPKFCERNGINHKNEEDIITFGQESAQFGAVTQLFQNAPPSIFFQGMPQN